jgi:hypothetical protein
VLALVSKECIWATVRQMVSMNLLYITKNERSKQFLQKHVKSLDKSSQKYY